jgi:hypothetical protein
MMARSRPRAEIDTKAKRTWDGIVWHHSTARDGVCYDWDAIKLFHTSYRVDSKVVDAKEYRKLSIQKMGREFGEPMRAVGFHAAVEHVEGAGGVFAPVIHLGRSLDLNGEHTSHKGSVVFNSRYLGLVAIGDFDAKPMPPEMWDQCLRLTRAMMEAFSIPAEKVLGHSEADAIAGVEKPRGCPGALWRMEKFRKDL